MTPNEDGPQTSALEALSRIYGDAAWRNAVGKEIRILLATEEGRNIVLTFANGLQEWASALKAAVSLPVKRGRPKKNSDEEHDRLRQALEYYDLRINGVPRARAIKVVLGERQDGSMFTHAARRSRSKESFMRDMRARWKQVSNVLDLLTVSTEQLADLRRELDNKSKSKSARTRK